MLGVQKEISTVTLYCYGKTKENAPSQILKGVFEALVDCEYTISSKHQFLQITAVAVDLDFYLSLLDGITNKTWDHFSVKIDELYRQSNNTDIQHSFRLEGLTDLSIRHRNNIDGESKDIILNLYSNL